MAKFLRFLSKKKTPEEGKNSSPVGKESFFWEI